MHEKWQASRGGRRVRTIITGLVTAVWDLGINVFLLGATNSGMKQQQQQQQQKNKMAISGKLRLTQWASFGDRQRLYWTSTFHCLLWLNFDETRSRATSKWILYLGQSQRSLWRSFSSSSSPLFLLGLQSESARVKDNPLKCRWRGHRIIFVYDSQKITSWLELNHTDSLIRNHRAGALFVFLLD